MRKSKEFEKVHGRNWREIIYYIIISVCIKDSDSSKGRVLSLKKSKVETLYTKTQEVNRSLASSGATLSFPKVT